MKKNCFCIALGLASCLVSGCASLRAVPEPAVALEVARAEIDSAAGYAPSSMRVMSKIDYIDGVNAKRVVGQDLVFSARPPLDMRITISAFDKAVSTLVSDGVGFALIDVGQNVYVTGYATPENISQILPVYLSAADLFRVIYGDFPRDSLAEDALQTQAFAWDAQAGGYCRTLGLANGGSMKVIYDWPSKTITQITVLDGDETLYTYEAAKFETVTAETGGAHMYPREIRFSLPKQKTDVRLRVEKRELDVELSEAVFRLPPPAGVQVIVME